MKARVVCQDKHEAAKLASLIFIRDGKETFISSILNVYGTEIVIELKDKSAHSITLKDTIQVEIFTDFIQSVLDKANQIVDIKIIIETVEITKG
ncbi:MAG: hypothetical protein EB150_00900 [Nitrososphaeria archaeon]|nr:hypothetical protein [Nitrososphaeria archaeon]NDB50669.1 hypothetical protein [Nitrosopumilaceae archaeon]NDB87558.1 hypothetical protein [Nitrososphaerota archaeon]NDB45775.1 hypothetical protein [Nitrososphaeria archaeon]NDB62268.1 hypothetical protein [Nitrosopumilaceae archaeon]